MPVLDLRLRALGFGGKQILGPINLQLPRGQTLALVGPSGIGKSSLLRIFAGLVRRYEGDCAVHGKTAMVFQEPTLLPWRSARDNITIPTGVTSDIADAALESVGLGQRAAAYPAQLSLGQQRRLSLARAFAVQPDLLLLDEPFVSLDPALATEMMDLFSELRAAHGVTTVLVTHVVQEANRLADRIVTLAGDPAVIHDDRMVRTGS
ncbi:ATP-binding cassette domain-containing protein [Yoonia sp. SS1-5]|uniref:ATP-binding cassette domain-containing protein n=1 Tax=Yoonia rhodophyticola TaxID=3137370 RepID=A0AAN0MD58_9RHOB